MDPFLSVVASAFPGRAGILYSNLKVHAKNTKSGKLQEKVFLSCVALKKEGPKRRFS